MGGLIQCEFLFNLCVCVCFLGGGVSDHFELVLQVKIVKRFESLSGTMELVARQEKLNSLNISR